MMVTSFSITQVRHEVVINLKSTSAQRSHLKVWSAHVQIFKRRMAKNTPFLQKSSYKEQRLILQSVHCMDLFGLPSENLQWKTPEITFMCNQVSFQDIKYQMLCTHGVTKLDKLKHNGLFGISDQHIKVSSIVLIWLLHFTGQPTTSRCQSSW